MSNKTYLSAAWMIALGVAVAACGSDDSEGGSTGGSGGSAGTTSDAGDQDAVADTGTPDATDKDADKPDVQHEAGACFDVTSVSGSAVDEAGGALADALATVCIYYSEEVSKCLAPKKTDAAGSFSVSMPEGSACLMTAAVNLKDTNDLSAVGLYCPIDVSAGGDVAMSGSMTLVKAPQCDRDPLADATQPHTVTNPEGASMTVVPDELWMFEFGYEDLRLRTWDGSSGWPCFVDPSNPPDGLVGFAPPLEVKSEDAVHVSFPNTAGLAAGTAVDLYILGDGATNTWDGDLVHEGEFAVIGEAVVSQDGTRIETKPGEGLPFGTWVGWKQK